MEFPELKISLSKFPAQLQQMQIWDHKSKFPPQLEGPQRKALLWPRPHVKWGEGELCFSPLQEGGDPEPGDPKLPTRWLAQGGASTSADRGAVAAAGDANDLSNLARHSK